MLPDDEPLPDFDPVAEDGPTVILEDLDADEPSILTPSEIYNELLTCGEMILTIPAEEEEKLRKGLASAKAKLNAKLKDSGLGTDSSVLSFNVSPAKEYSGAVQVVITLAKRTGITVLAKEYPDPDF